ncbi:hypothetical protein [Pararhizobium sp.]|uniref:hypothetical protein n=1 Tax=Pararhizobium sp. TaxID=1977563 RepID=UPI003D1303B9
MYTAFDPFLNVDTWHTSHPTDDRRFYIALATVVKNPGFSPDEMGEYMRNSKGITFDTRIENLVHSAWAVREYLQATGVIPSP